MFPFMLFPHLFQTPVPPPTMTELITGGTTLVTDMGIMPVIFAGAVAGVGVFIFRRVRTASR